MTRGGGAGCDRSGFAGSRRSHIRDHRGRCWSFEGALGLGFGLLTISRLSLATGRCNCSTVHNL